MTGDDVKNRAMQRRADPAAMDVFDRIRDGVRFVAAYSDHVAINESRLVEYAMSLSPRPPANVLDPAHHFDSAEPEALAAYIMTLESVNFGSGYEDALRAEGWAMVDDCLYYTVSTALKNCFDHYGPLPADVLRGMNVHDCHALFGLPHGPAGQELAVLFTAGLNEMGAFIAESYDGSFAAFVRDANGSAARLVTQLASLPGFADVHEFHGRMIPFYKRAQIAAADLHLAFARHGRPLFGDIDRLTIFADNAVPHVLAVDGVLTLSDALSARIAAGELIPAGGAAEVALRACAVQAVEMLAAIKGARVMDIDHLLWHRSVEDARYTQTPPHRTRTRFY